MDIHPDKQNIDTLFSNTDYYIDFYQREYKWTKDQVNILIEDIFYKFNQEYNKDLKPTMATIQEKYSWYYLNTLVTNVVDGKTYVVDGQQRLTTLSLILIILFHLAREFDLEERAEWIQSKLYGTSGEGKHFWMGHGKREKMMQILFDAEIDEKEEENPKKTLTEENMLLNFNVINKSIRKQLSDVHKVDSFILFFLKRIVLIKLDVSQTDVPMVFEVINDRGIRLQPYEILKGKLLGQIDKSEVGEYNKIWEDSIQELERVKDKKLVDDFFRTYLKSKLARTRTEAKKFDGNYQRVIFDKEFESKLQLKNSSSRVKEFISNDFAYFINLYKKIFKYNTYYDFNHEFRYIYFNDMNRMDSQNMLILSVCGINDENEKQKIKIISKQVDKLYVILQLNQSYNSNRFLEIIYELLGELENKDIDDYPVIFNRKLIDEINKVKSSTIDTPFQYKFFKSIGYPDFNTRFLRYFFTRIEYFLTINTNHKLIDDIWDLTGTIGANAYHVEHILGRNEENIKLFDNDEEKFEQERNRLGGLLLLKGRDNQSSGNERYKEKRKTYSGTLLWNQSLTEEFYHSKLDHKNFIDKYSLDLKPYDIFDQNAVDERTKLLFELVKLIWE